MRLIDRRSFLASAGAAFAASLTPHSAEALSRTEAVFGAACQKADGSYGCAVFTEEGRILSLVDLPDRGHDITFDPITRRAVAFARRPRTFAVVFDPASGRTLHTITSQDGRHFFGHGFFSPDGRLLYATENEIETAEGLVGIYDVGAGFRRVGEFPTHGMDPHEALLMPDGETIVVANGGIETHPDFGRQKLNLPTMEPSLAFIERRTGRLIEKQTLGHELHQLSIRHLAVDARQRVWFGCQYEGNPSDLPQLVGFASRGESIALVPLDPEPLASLANYVGSVAASTDGSLIALASPKGNAILTFDAAATRPAGRYTLTETCGLAPVHAGFIATGGQGDVMLLADEVDRRPSDRVLWDNHILAMAGL
ncbi:MAG: DUF1513 domain-containing protein [Rhizobiaceae bacterium]|nr:DUF1513 domain-containing protein [Rhizobiaceae bacterium]